MKPPKAVLKSHEWHPLVSSDIIASVDDPLISLGETGEASHLDDRSETCSEIPRSVSGMSTSGFETGPFSLSAAEAV